MHDETAPHCDQAVLHAPTPDLSSLRRAVQLRDRCRAAAVAASQRLEMPMSPAQANVAFDAMVDLIRDDDKAANG